MIKTRTVILSLDALGKEDEGLYEEEPALARVLSEGARLRAVRSVTPTLTYPAHATIITGRSPSSHGIVNNTKVQPSRAVPDWFWHSRDIKGDTLFRAARRQKMKVGAVLWPVSAGARIHWNLAEIWPHRPWQTQATVTLANSTKTFAIRMAKKYGDLLDGIQQPQLDQFAHACATEILEKEDFDLLFVHYTDIDAHKHRFGTKAPEVKEAVTRTAQKVGEVIRTLEQRGLYESTNLILLSDHSQRDIRRALRINQVFYRHALLDARGDRITDWRAYASSCEGSCYVYIDKKDPQLLPFVRELLEDIRRIHGGIDRIHTREQAVAAGGDPDCAFYLTAEKGVVFSNGINGDIFGEMDKDYRANHGYPPDLPNYEAMFAARGPAFRHTTVDTQVPMTDIGPTIARAAGLDLRGAQGSPVQEILR